MTEFLHDAQHKSGTGESGLSGAALHGEIRASRERCRKLGLKQNALPRTGTSSEPRIHREREAIPFLGPEFTAIAEYLKAVGAVYMLRSRKHAAEDAAEYFGDEEIIELWEVA